MDDLNHNYIEDGLANANRAEDTGDRFTTFWWCFAVISGVGVFGSGVALGLTWNPFFGFHIVTYSVLLGTAVGKLKTAGAHAMSYRSWRYDWQQEKFR